MTVEEVDRLCRVAEGFEARHRDFADAAKQNAHDHDFARAQAAIGAAYRTCAEQLRDAIADLATPTAQDFDDAADEIAGRRYALVEQMGFRRTYGTVRETEFLGKPMLEVTNLETGAVSLAAPESLYALTWLTRQQAEAATRTGSHSPKALSAAIAGDLASWGAGDEYGDDGKDDGVSQAERDEYDREGEFLLDAADEARDLEREAEADL